MKIGDRVRAKHPGDFAYENGKVVSIGLKHDLTTILLQASFGDSRLVYGFTRDELEYVNDDA